MNRTFWQQQWQRGNWILLKPSGLFWGQGKFDDFLSYHVEVKFIVNGQSFKKKIEPSFYKVRFPIISPMCRCIVQADFGVQHYTSAPFLNLPFINVCQNNSRWFEVAQYCAVFSQINTDSKIIIAVCSAAHLVISVCSDLTVVTVKYFSISSPKKVTAKNKLLKAYLCSIYKIFIFFLSFFDGLLKG